MSDSDSDGSPDIEEAEGSGDEKVLFLPSVLSPLSLSLSLPPLSVSLSLSHLCLS